MQYVTINQLAELASQLTCLNTIGKGVNGFWSVNAHLGHIPLSLKVKCTGCDQAVMLAKMWLMLTSANGLSNPCPSSLKLLINQEAVKWWCFYTTWNWSTAQQHYASIWASHHEPDVRGQWPLREYGLLYRITFKPIFWLLAHIIYKISLTGWH